MPKNADTISGPCSAIAVPGTSKCRQAREAARHAEDERHESQRQQREPIRQGLRQESAAALSPGPSGASSSSGSETVRSAALRSSSFIKSETTSHPPVPGLHIRQRKLPAGGLSWSCAHEQASTAHQDASLSRQPRLLRHGRRRSRPHRGGHGAARYFEKGQWVVQCGDPCTGFHLVVSTGQIKLAFPSPQGVEKVLKIIRPGLSSQRCFGCSSISPIRGVRAGAGRRDAAARGEARSARGARPEPVRPAHARRDGPRLHGLVRQRRGLHLALEPGARHRLPAGGAARGRFERRRPKCT